MFSKALAAFFFASASEPYACFAVGGTPLENLSCHRWAPDCGFREAVDLLGGVGNCAPALAQGFPLTPDAPGYRFDERPKVASYFAFSAGLERTSFAA